MHFFRNFFITLAFLCIVLLGLPWLVPTASYTPKIEAMAESQLNQKVNISSFRLALLPTPRVHINGLKIGDSLLVVDSVTVIPKIFTLLSEHKVISAIQVDKPSVKSEVLPLLSELTHAQTDSGKTSKIEIQSIEVSEFEYLDPTIKLPKFNLSVELQNNKLIKAHITSLDGVLSALLSPIENEKESYSLQVDAHDWILPISYPFNIDRLNIQAVIRGDEVNISKLEAASYKGKIIAQATLSFAQLWRLKGSIKVEGLSLAPALNVITAKNKLSGELMLSGPFSAQAKTAKDLPKKLMAHLDFEIKHGLIKGIDLLKIASLLLTKSNSDGNTEFDSFTGQLFVAGEEYEVKNLNISSGLIKASGGVKIKKSKALSGLVKVEVKNSASMVAVPLDVSGTVADPTVLPTKSAMAGAVVGTAILGPGVGTSVGLKVGEKLESIKKGLFGGK